MSTPQAAAKRRQDDEPVIARSVLVSARHDMEACRASSWRRLDPLADTRRANARRPAAFIEGVLMVASSSDSRRNVSPAADEGQATIEAVVVIAREHRGGVRSGAGAIEEDDMVIGVARGVVASDVEQILDHTRAVVAPQVQDEVKRVGVLVGDCACAQWSLPPSCPRE